MATTHDPSSQSSGPNYLDEDVVELEPTMMLSLAEDGAVPWDTDASKNFKEGATRRPAVAMVEGSLASLAGETNTLRRSRLAAAALFLTCMYAILFAWNLLSWANTLNHSWFLMGSRFALSAVLAGVLFSRIELTAARLRWLEVALFGGLTLLLVYSQYAVNLGLMQRGDLPGMIAFIKNGVIQMFVLMILYGMFIPNRPKNVAYVVLAMALAPLFSIAFLTEHKDVAPMLVQFRSVEQSGSNILFLIIGAGMSIYGAYLLNGLRTELHAAKKFGQYRLVRKLGSGGMGEVHLAEHELLKRPCALKLIRSESGGDPLALARFEREVRASARLRHPNSIEIYDYGNTNDGTFYYVMEYLEGLSLADLIKVAGPLSPGRVIYLLRQVCGGLAEAHGIGLVHRDLKPANIFVAVRGGESDVAKVLDFGLVKLTQQDDAAELTSNNVVSGTPHYMPPEQARGAKDLDARADIYALGGVAYFMLTGRPPFQGETAFEVMMAHARDTVAPPSTIQPGVPADLEQIVLRCLAKDPGERYPSVRALSEALSACASANDWGANRADAWWAASKNYDE